MLFAKVVLCRTLDVARILAAFGSPMLLCLQYSFTKSLPHGGVRRFVLQCFQLPSKKCLIHVGWLTGCFIYVCF